MNYYGARELLGEDGKGTGKFHYTCMNDGQVWPVGYCSAFRNCDACDGRITNISGMLVCEISEGQGGPHCPKCNGRGCVEIPRAERCPGHATKEEACEHQKQYELDRAHYRPETEDMRQRAAVLSRCEICGHFTCGYASYGAGGMRVHYLCNEHCNRETLAGLVNVGWSASSC